MCSCSHPPDRRVPPAGYAGSGAPVPQSDPTRRPCLALVSGRHTQRQRLTMPVPPHNRQQLQPLAYRRRPCIRADLRTWPASRHHHQHHHQQQPAGESLRVNPWGSFVISFTVPRHERCAVRASCLAVCGTAGRDRPGARDLCQPAAFRAWRRRSSTRPRAVRSIRAVRGQKTAVRVRSRPKTSCPAATASVATLPARIGQNRPRRPSQGPPHDARPDNNACTSPCARAFSGRLLAFPAVDCRLPLRVA